MMLKRPWLIAVLGVLLAAGAYGLVYIKGTSEYRALEHECGPELAWIKKEFHLSDADFKRVRVLHEAYKPVCAEMCRRIDGKHAELARLLQTSSIVTPEIELVLGQAADLRQQCQTEMLRHFFQVSQVMPPDQGRRYLAWMHEQTLAPAHSSMLPKVGVPASHDAAHH